ncbi:hypothetical protein [Treponema sp.]|uniref:hypothetical protein n=1 Tax=Treponema sp. TaxID=166 RepID=UPI00298E7821|nr:hypothetical protein [Treponema sp.]
MKKVNLFFLAVVFIFASCNLPLNNDGKISFELDDAVVEKALNIAKEVSGSSQYPVTIEVNVHGRIEKSQSKVISTKSDVNNLSFDFDIPKNTPSDIEVLITIDKSVVLYRGVTRNVMPDNISGAVDVVLSQVFEIKQPKFVATVNGSPVKFIRQDECEISVVAEDGSRYPDFVKTKFEYIPSEQVSDVESIFQSMELTGSKPKTIKFSDFKDDEFNPCNVKTNIATDGWLSDTNSSAVVSFKPHMYTASSQYILPSSSQPEVGGGYIAVKDLETLDTCQKEYIKEAYAVDYAIRSEGADFLASDKSVDVSYVRSTSWAYSASNGDCPSYGPISNWLNGIDGDFKTRGESKSICYDIDTETTFVTGIMDEKVVVLPYCDGSFKDLIKLPINASDVGNFNFRTAVYDEKIYILIYTTGGGELRVYTLDSNPQLVNTVNLEKMFPKPDGANENVNYISRFNSNSSMDLLVWQDKVYMLYSEVGCTWDSSFGYTNGISRGAVIEYDPVSMSVSRTFGWTPNDKPSAIFKATNYNDNGTVVKTPRLSPDSIKSTTGLFGPQRFIALEPKKLVILDSGEFTYIESGLVKGKKVNRVVEIDLETFTIGKVTHIADIQIGTELHCFNPLSSDFGGSAYNEPHNCQLIFLPTDSGSNIETFSNFSLVQEDTNVL